MLFQWFMTIFYFFSLQVFAIADSDDHLLLYDESGVQVIKDLIFSTGILNWTDAIKACHVMGRALVQIDSGQVHVAVANRALSKRFNYWTGGYRDKGDSWIWMLHGKSIPLLTNKSNRNFQEAWYKGLWKEPNGSPNVSVALMVRNLTSQNNFSSPWADVLPIFPEHYVCQKDYVCDEATLNGYNFPSVKIGSISYSKKKCQSFSKARIRCDHQEIKTPKGPQWGAVFNNKTFIELSCDTTISTIQFNASDATPESTEKTLTSIATVIVTFKPNETKYLNEILSEITNFLLESSAPVKTSTLVSIANITSSLNSRKQSANLSETLVTSIVQFSQKLELNEGVFEEQFNNLLIKVEDRKISPNKTINGSNVDVSQPNNNDSLCVNIPSDAVQRRDENGTLRVSIVLFENSNLFPSKKASADWVLSIELGKHSLNDLTNLSKPLKLITNITREDRKDLKVKCGFWNETEREWDTFGCKLSRDEGRVVCECNHLTSFAVIFVPEINLLTLSILSKIGCSITVGSLLITIIIYLVFRKTRTQVTTRIQISVYCNMMLAYLVFLFGTERSEQSVLCTVMTALLHYLMLTTWFWMAVYAFKLYRIIVLRSIGSSWYLLKAFFFAHGIPLVIVAFNLFLAFGYFNWFISMDQVEGKKEFNYYRSSELCWLHGYSLYFGFLLFLAIILIINILFIALILAEKIRKRRKAKIGSQHITQKEIIILATMIVQLGVTWIFGFLLLIFPGSTFSLIFSYIFTGLNAFQGLSIFYFACILRKEVFEFWFLPIKNFIHKEKIIQANASQTISTFFSKSNHHSKIISKNKTTHSVWMSNSAADNKIFEEMNSESYLWNTETLTTIL